ncbi:MAG: ATP-binding cassette domain-containing protein [Armatimonadota bacterium]
MVDVRGLTKQFRNVTAVWNLTLQLEEGDVFGFIGPNGAGKTTTIKMLATLLRPNAGTAYICGYDITRHQEEVRSLIGYMPDFFGVYDDIKVWEYLDFFAAAYRIDRTRRPQIIDDVLALTDLTGKKDSYVEELSRGMKQRLCLAKTLVHDPRVLLLDEPASGLDPRARIEIRELLKELRAMGKTIFISSHILSELSDFCNKIGIIENGQLVCAGEVSDILQHISGCITIVIKMRDGLQRAQEVLEPVPYVQNIRSVEAEHTLLVEYVGPREDIPTLLERLVSAGVQVLSFGEEEADLEDIFIKMTQGIVS